MIVRESKAFWHTGLEKGEIQSVSGNNGNLQNIMPFYKLKCCLFFMLNLNGSPKTGSELGNFYLCSFHFSLFLNMFQEISLR